MGAKVSIAYTARLADGTLFDERPEADPLTFTTDEGELSRPRGLRPSQLC